MPEHIKKFVYSCGIEQTRYNSIEEVVEVADVLYVTRFAVQTLLEIELSFNLSLLPPSLRRRALKFKAVRGRMSLS